VSEYQPRYYTVSEANDALPEIVPELETLREAHRAMEERQEAVTTSVPTNGGGTVHREFIDASDVAARAIEHIEALGVMVRDPETGLIDFYAEREGEIVFLCWRLGEDKVEWWHPTDTGFAGRERL
jgi:hypothetical protein